jgi:hypothetical protein
VILQTSRDTADWVLFGAQIVGLVIALVALGVAVFQVREARKEAKEAQETQRKERRIDFELTVLRELLIASNQGDVLRVQALASTVSESVVPITRAAAELPTTRQGEFQVTRLNLAPGTHPSANFDLLKTDVMAELVKAIDKRVDERASIG